MLNKKTLYSISFWLVIIGAINTGLYGLFAGDIPGDTDLLNFIFAGDFSVIAVIIETLIGVAGVYLLYIHFSSSKNVEKK